MTILFRLWRMAKIAVPGALMVLLAPATLFAGEAGFQAGHNNAYPHYREAVFYTRTGNTPVAALALDEFVVKWSALVEAHGDSPPGEYAGDEAWKSTLQDILTRAETGLEALDADDPEAAADSIGPIRAILGDLRRRNNVVTWSNRVDALSTAMDLLARYRKEVRNLEDDAAVALVRDQAALVQTLFEKCQAEAAPDLAADPEFIRLIDGAAESMGRLLEALETKDPLLLRIGIGELRSYERIMFLRFG